jgi:ribosomal protein S18 acetylase RimI-like enzyme
MNPAAITPDGREGADMRDRKFLIRCAKLCDLEAITAIHQSSFGEAFLSQLGRRFLKQYYQLVLGFRGGILLVAENGQVIKGFAAGFLEPDLFYREMMRNRWRFVWPLLFAAVRHPSLLGRILAGFRQVRHATRASVDGLACELSSIAVSPEDSSRGAGTCLLRAFIDTAWTRDAEMVYLTTDATNLVANALYRREGFTLIQTFHRSPGREMNEYAMYRKSTAPA